jgi:serine/threonine-protein phosphatase CPPED1
MKICAYMCGIVVLFCGTTIYAQTSNPAFFMLLADPQMGMFEKDVSWSQESANLDFAVATANRLHPAFVLICGDLVNKGGDLDEINAFRYSVSKLDPLIPLHLVAGNHDVGNVPTAASLKAYRSRFGPDYYTFRSDNLYAIVLDSSLMGTPGNEVEDDVQLQWLDKQLSMAQTQGVKPEDIAIFQHIPLFLGRVDEANMYFNVPLVSRNRYLEVLHRHQVTHVFAGHYHRNAEAVDGSLSMVTTGPIGKPLGPDGSGLRLVHFGKNWKSPYFELGRLPDGPTMQQWTAGWRLPLNQGVDLPSH